MRGLLALAAALCAAAPAWAQVGFTSPGPDQVTVAVYRDRPVSTVDLMKWGENSFAREYGLALILETRTVDLPAGEGVIRFEGLATGIVPETATLAGLPAEVAERNTDFELLSPGGLFDRSVGEQVQVVRINPRTGREETIPAVIRASARGPVLEIDGRIEALDCQGLTQRVIFDRVPTGLNEQPVLSVRTRAPRAGRYTVTLAYLATGLQWSADYVARLNADGTMDLSGWITLANFGGTSFREAPVQVVAGKLNSTYETEPVEVVAAARSSQCWPTDRTTDGPIGLDPLVAKNVRDYLATIPGLSNSEAGEIDEVVVTGARIVAGELVDYKIYTLPERTDLNARQTKQVRFLDQPGVRYSRIYRYVAYADADYYDEEDGPERPDAFLKVRNLEADGLGLPLPGGSVSLVEMRNGKALMSGQADFIDRAVGLPIELDLGEAAGIVVSTEMLESEDLEGGRPWRKRATMAVTVSNDQDVPVEVEIVSGEAAQEDFRLLRSSQRTVVLETGDTAWRVRVPPGRSRTLTYTIQYRD